MDVLLIVLVGGYFDLLAIRSSIRLHRTNQVLVDRDFNRAARKVEKSDVLRDCFLTARVGAGITCHQRKHRYNQPHDETISHHTTPSDGKKEGRNEEQGHSSSESC